MISSSLESNTTTKHGIYFHPLLRLGAKVVSYVFHPLFVPLYLGWFLIYEMQLFPEQDLWHKSLLLISIFVIYTLLPLVTIVLTKALGLVQSVYLKTQKDRIIPYVICEIYYFWGWYVSRNLSYPKELAMFELGIFLSVCLGMILNSFIKLSMHAICFGVVSTFMLIYGLEGMANAGFYITIALMLSAVVCTARMITADHDSREIYTGLVTGIIGEILGFLFT
ncbi:MAG: hypothetical protein NVS1B13_00320 [Flavisolibacter sp.]